ncbi:MAG TPA: substrate-binding domain-containing protein [candidate division Zixibacteria bacterium]|nr:substrate-binding domain-containing protein [candidate division Zixibacteria bacterium]
MRVQRIGAVLGVVAIGLAACTGTPGGSAPASAGGDGASDCTVAVSWNNYQQPRWAAADQPNIKGVVEAAGATYIEADANLSSEQQLTDVSNLIGQGADVLILLAQDQNAVLPAVQQAKDSGIPVIAYDRLIEDPDILYITFNNVGVGEAQAAAILEEVPEGNYVLIKGDPGDPNASTFLPQGWDNAGLKEKVDAGEITILNGPEGGSGEWPADYGTYTDAWDTATAQANMEAIIDAANADGVTIDAILAENDSTALGVVAALEAKSYGFPPLSGQDGDPGNLNNVALGKQFVDVWKNANELGKAAGQAALALCEGTPVEEITIDVEDSVAPEEGNSPVDFETPGGNTVKSIILKPTPITAENLSVVIDAGWWVTKEQICEGVTADDPGAEACGV